MNLISVIDLISAVFFLIALICACRKRAFFGGSAYARYFMYFSLLIYVFVGVFNCLEDGGITAFFDQFKDYLELLFIPCFLFFIFLVRTGEEQNRREHAEKEILQGERRFGTFAENVPGIVYRRANDKDWTMEFISRDVEKISGYPASDFISEERNFESIIFQEDRQKVRDAVDKGLDEREPYEMEYRLIHKDGSMRWVYEKGSGVFDKEGDLVCLEGICFDVTERKQTEIKNSRIVQFLNDAQSMAHVGCWERDLKTGENYCSDEIYRMLGCEPGEFEPSLENFMSYVHPDDVEGLYNSVYSEDKDTGVRYNEYRIIDKKGEERFLVAQAKFDVDEKGDMIRVYGTVQDVTEQVRAERELRESEERFRAIAESTTDAIITTDSDLNIIYWNRAAEKMFGYSGNEAVGQSMSIIMLEDFAARMPNTQKEYIEKGDYRIFKKSHEGKGKRKDHSEFPVDISLSYWEIDNHYYFNAIVRDITERKKAQDEIKETKEFFESVFRTTLDGILVSDSKGYLNMVNDAVIDMFGYTREELIGSHVTMLASKAEADKKQGQEIMETLYKYGQVVSVEDVWVKKDGTPVYIEESMKLLKNEAGSIEAVVGSVRNITERKKTEEENRKLQVQLNRAEKMETIGTLAGGVAHDLNNILGAIVGYPDLILDDIPKGSPLRRSVLAIKESGERAASIVQDLLTLARRGIALNEVVNLNTVINRYLDSREFMKMQGFYPAVEVKTSLSEDVLNVSGSPVHLSKVVMNLVNNAAEAIPGSGRIVISTENIYMDKPVKGYDRIEEGDYVSLTVSDNGVGIPSEDLKRIFEPFYTKKVMGRSGTGLGMSVVWGTVKDHRGYIDIESREGVGTTFKLYFPVTRMVNENSTGPVPIESYVGNGQRILVIDDVQAQCEIAVQMLTKLNYRVVSVNSGEKAVVYLKTNKADLLVLDMIMDPGIDGLETYKEILEISPGQKAIIASGFSETDRVKEAQRIGAGEYIRKPYTLEKIGLAVKSVLSK